MSKFFLFIIILGTDSLLVAQNNIVTIDPAKTFQVIDGFGAHQGSPDENTVWWSNLYYDDMGCSIYRVDLTPQLKSPYSDLSYFSPWFMGSGTKSVFNFEDPSNPNGPENNRVRTYTSPNDYSRTFGGRQAPIAVMGPDIENNITKFSYQSSEAIKNGMAKKSQLGDFKLIGSVWSPVPWVKVSSGNRYPENWWPGPVMNTPWPFVWGGNFSGGRLDVSGTPLAVFNDASQGGTGMTSSLTQFARSTAAYILGYQRFHNVPFYAISIQNELNFEVFYSCATYPLSSQYISAVKAVRAEFDKYPELKSIKIMGPEDLLGGDSYGMWEYGGPVHKNLQYLKNIEADPLASKAVEFYCIHGYANDGVTSSGSNPREWDWWVNGWTTSPAAGIPANVKGFSSFNKKSWMTETSGENRDWLFPKNAFPGEGGLGVALRIHQALTAGMESAWLYWTFTDSDGTNVSNYGLTNQAAGVSAPKYVAAKHYFKYIRPNSLRIEAISGNTSILSSAYLNDVTKTITAVILNTSNRTLDVELRLAQPNMNFNVFSSSENNYWMNSNVNLISGKLQISLPPYSVHTLTGKIPNNSSTEIIPNEISGLDLVPNPFVKNQKLVFHLNNSGQVQIELLGINGNRIRILENRFLQKGTYEYLISGEELVNGISFIKIQTREQLRVIKTTKID